MLCYHTRYVGNFGGLCGVNRSDVFTECRNCNCRRVSLVIRLASTCLLYTSYDHERNDASWVIVEQNQLCHFKRNKKVLK